MSTLWAVAQRVVRCSIATGVVVLLSMAGVDAGETAPQRFPVTLDRSRILESPETITKVSVTNPKIADVTVLSPRSVLINAKGVGVTSVMIFSGAKVNAFDVVVRPTGLSKDGASTVYRRIAVPAGEHRFVARLADTADGRFVHAVERSIDLEPGRVLVIDFDAKSGGWLFRG